MSAPGPTPLDLRVAELIRAEGPQSFWTVQDLALYDPEFGFYASGGSAGRRGDFITSPEVGPLFGTVVARALDGWWDELGQPDPFFFFEMGAGVGTLAISVLAAAPRCAGALRYVLIERSEALAARHGDHLELTDIETTMGLSGGQGRPIVCSYPDLPMGFEGPYPVVGVAFGNELLDNIPIHLVAKDESGWRELRVDLVADGDGFVLVPAPADVFHAEWAQKLMPDAETGTVAPIFESASVDLLETTHALDQGRVVFVDYGTRTTAELVTRGMDDWLRAYRGHERLADPLAALGTADITSDVAIDGLAMHARPFGERAQVTSQAEWLRAHGIDELVEEGRQVWEAGAATGELAALKARSRVREAEALLDPDGLGGFLVAEWQVG